MASTALSGRAALSALRAGSRMRLLSAAAASASSPSADVSRLSPPAPPTYSSLRNKITLPFQIEPGKPYVSPYSKFFASVEAGETTMGTTLEMEQAAFELQEQRLECGIKESHLRFITKSYGRFQLPPYVSPGEHRITVKVAESDIPFENDREREVFRKIVGPRLRKGDLQLSSEKFASRIENKRYLVDMIERIVAESRRLAKEFAEGDGEKSGNAD